MTFPRYLKSSWPAVALMVACAALCGFMLAMAGVNTALVWLVVLVIAGVSALALYSGYQSKRSFYDDLAACSDGVEHPLWIMEMIEEPEFIEGRIAYDALRSVAKAANDDVSACQRRVSDYREYVETWVHEAKSPLAAAHLMLENLTESMPATDEGADLLDKTAALGDELDRMEGYIEQALFFARSETLDRDYLIRSHRLGDLVAAAVKANARALIGAHMVPVREGLDFTVFTDEKWMTFVLGQLIQNSVKYAAGMGSELRFTAALCDEGRASEHVELTVRDNGCGVSEADLPRVFDRGFTGDNGRAGKRSTGIGLYLVRRLCDKMGLTVRADSVPEEFFAVTISFSTNKMHYFE